MSTRQTLADQNRFLWTQRSTNEGESDSQLKIPVLSKTFVDTNSLFKRINHINDQKSQKFRNLSMRRLSRKDSQSSIIKNNDFPWVHSSRSQRDFLLSEYRSIEGSMKGTYLSEFPKFNDELLYETNPLFMISNINPLIPRHTGKKSVTFILDQLKEINRLLYTNREKLLKKQNEVKPSADLVCKVSKISKPESHTSQHSRFKTLIRRSKQSVPNLKSTLDKFVTLKIFEKPKEADPLACASSIMSHNSSLLMSNLTKEPQKLK